MPSLLKLAAELGLNTKPFEAGLKQSEKLALQTGEAIASKFKGFVASYFGFKAFDALIVKTIDRAREIKHLSDQFQITTAEVQYLGKAAGRVGLEMDDFGTALDKLGTARKEAIESSAELRSEFARYGISLQMLNDPSVRNIDLLKQMSIALRNMGQTTQRDRNLFRDLFGRSGARLVEALKQYQEAPGAKIVSEKDVKAIYEAERAMIQLRKQWEILASKPIGFGAGFLANQLEFFQTDKISRVEKLFRAFATATPLFSSLMLPNWIAQDRLRNGAKPEVLGPPSEQFFERQRGETLYNDQIAAKSKLELGKSEAELQKTINEFLFERLTREGKIIELKRQQSALASQIMTTEDALRELQMTDEDRNETIRSRNGLLEQQLKIQDQIDNLDNDKVGFQKALEVRGASAAIGAFSRPGGSDALRVNGKQLTTQEQILQILRDNIPGKNTITFSQ